MMFFKIFASIIDALVLIITVLYMAQSNDSEVFVPLFLYGMSVVFICLIAALRMWV